MSVAPPEEHVTVGCAQRQAGNQRCHFAVPLSSMVKVSDRLFSASSNRGPAICTDSMIKRKINPFISLIFIFLIVSSAILHTECDSLSQHYRFQQQKRFNMSKKT
jgi:hypothetical protein